MFLQLELTNFRQHESLTLNFEQGVIALRGRNEAGKTTIIEAISYALFGAAGLQEPLAEVVTYTKKVSTLKVRLTFKMGGVIFLVTRSSSGAEIYANDKLEATGQTEVRKFVERLIGAPADVCINLMFANQASIRGALSKPGAAVELIEMLSNLSIIDRLIGFAQEQLDCGATTTTVARITTLEEQLTAPLEDTTSELKSTLAERQVSENLVKSDYDKFKIDYDKIQTAARAAQDAVNKHTLDTQAEARAKTTLTNAETTLASIKVGTCPTEAQVAELRLQATDASRFTRAAGFHKELTKLPEPENEWEGTVETLKADRLVHANALAHANSLRNELERDIIRLQSQKITQTECGLCGKDLSNIPEVVTKNAGLDSQIATKDAELNEVKVAQTTATEMVAAYDGILSAASACQGVYQRAAEFIDLDYNYVPARWAWKGPDINKPVATDAAVKLAQLEAQVRDYHSAVGRQEQAQTAVATANQALTAIQTSLKAQAAGLKVAQKVLENAATLTATLNTLSEQLREAQDATKSARQALQSAEAVHEAQAKARAAVQTQLSDAKAELAEKDDNNAMIKFLREARPAIADELWGTVIASISTYFSDIRGRPSLVERTDNSFQVDGHSITGLSGSTKDALGLAIRKALTKVFLPQTSFMVLDEPAAACDDERETNMLSLIATSGFEQVIVVSHSDLLDGFANQIIQL